MVKKEFNFIVVSCVFLFVCGITVNSQENQDRCIPLCEDDVCRCPGGQFLFKDNTYTNVSSCEYPSSTSTVNPNTSQSNNQASSTSKSDDGNVSYVCLRTCPDGYFGDNESLECNECDSLCSSCTGSGNTTDICTCRYGNNNETCVDNQAADEGGVNIAVIAGAVTGGVLAVIMIIVFVVVCVCRQGKKKTAKSRMSTLIENRDDTIDNRTHIIDETKPQRPPQKQQQQRKIPTLTRPTYENTNTIDDSKVANQAQLNQDKIFRYTKEPTDRIQKVEEKNLGRDSGLYGNADAIRLHRNIDKGVSADDVELSMLGEAPKPPGQTKSKKKSSGRANKKGIVNPVVTTTDEYYEEMSGKPAEQSNYTPFDPNTEEIQEDYENYERSNEDEPLEDYENFGKTSSLVFQTPKEDEDEVQEDYENFQNAEELEDYENAAAAVAGGPPPRVQRRRGTGHSSAMEEESPYMNVSDIKT